MQQPDAEIALLGPLEVRVGGVAVAVVRPMQRALLARLALDAGTCVSSTRLIDALWGEATPGSSGHALQVHVSSLRKLLGPGLVETCPGGYRLAVPRDAVDALRAEQLVADGAYDDALALYRGQPLADVALEGHAAHEDARLADLRVDALERRTDERLAAGEGAALVAGLERLVGESPLRERPRAQLMLALYRAGRQADALAAYQEARRTFVDELGLEPSRELRALEAAILRQDETLLPSPQVAPVARRRRVRVAIASAGFALVAGAAGVGAAYLIPAGHPHAAVARTRTNAQRTTTTRPTTTARPVRPRHRRNVVHHKPVAHTRTVATTTTTTHVGVVRRRPRPATTEPGTTTVPATTTTTRVATHPIRTTPPPTTTAAPPTTTDGGAVHIVDTFDTSVVDGSLWNVLFNGDGADIVQRNGKLVVSIAAGATPGGSYDFVGAQYGSRGCFSGDIDMQVDYKLDTWPAGSGAYVGLQAVYANAMVERFAPVGGTDVVGSIIDPRFKQVSTSATSGSLRLTRVNGIVTTYYLAAGAWQPVDTAPAPNPAHLHIGVSIVPATSPPSNIVVELDNFSATAYGPTTC